MKLNNIEQMMDQIVKKLSAKEPDPPLQSQLDLYAGTPSFSVTDEDINSIFSFCTSSPSFHSPDFTSPTSPLPGTSYNPPRPLFTSNMSPQLDRGSIVSPSLPPPSLPPSHHHCRYHWRRPCHHPCRHHHCRYHWVLQPPHLSQWRRDGKVSQR